MPVKVHVMTGGMPLARFRSFAARTAAAGYSGIVVTEAGRTAYLSCAAAAADGIDLDLATGVAVAFAQSPMVAAMTAWELAEASGGRFRLGLGSQVKAHVERRYGAPFDPPGPRLREYVLAVRGAFRAFRGDAPLDVSGRFYNLSLLPPAWSPGPIDVPDPPVDVAAVNPWMLRMAGEVADGVHLHPINTATYVQETVLPSLAEGARVAGRAVTDLAVFVPLFTVVGDTEEERLPQRETVRRMVAFYGSTPNYGFVFEQLGHPGTTARLREAQRSGERAASSSIVTDELLAHFVVEGTWDELAGRILDRCGALRRFPLNVVLYLAAGAAGDGDSYERLGAVAGEVGATE